MRGLGERLRESAAAFRDVGRNPRLRRLQLALAASEIGQWAYGVALSVYAYRSGGASAVGLVWLVRMIPSALSSPALALLADRFPRTRVMVGADVVRAGLLGAGAAAIWLDSAPGVVYAIAALVSMSGTAFRPAQAALVPSLAATPAELTAANVAANSLQSVAFFAGPALAGALLAASSAATVLTLTAATFVWSAFFVFRIGADRPPPQEAGSGLRDVVTRSLAGFGAIAADSRLRLLVFLFSATTLVVGAFEVLLVVSALELLDLGKSGVGWLNAAFGVGALAGALAAAALVGVRRLSVPFLAGTLLWGLPLALLAAWPNTAFALVAFGVVGAGNTILDVAGFTLVQRSVRDDVLARVFGVIQMLWLGTVGIGAVVAPPLVHWLGVRGALVATGFFLPALVAILGYRLVRIDAEATVPGPELTLLRAIPIFAPLPGISLEHLAAQLVPLRVEPGALIVRRGDRGDRFYLVAEGEVEVEVEGHEASTLGPGEYFGEIALLRDIPRTATVRARTPVTLYALERDDFLSAVTRHAPSAHAAETVVATRLGALPDTEPALVPNP